MDTLAIIGLVFNIILLVLEGLVVNLIEERRRKVDLIG